MAEGGGSEDEGKQNPPIDHLGVLFPSLAGRLFLLLLLLERLLLQEGLGLFVRRNFFAQAVVRAQRRPGAVAVAIAVLLLAVVAPYHPPRRP